MSELTRKEIEELLELFGTGSGPRFEPESVEVTLYPKDCRSIMAALRLALDVVIGKPVFEAATEQLMAELIEATKKYDGDLVPRVLEVALRLRGELSIAEQKLIQLDAERNKLKEDLKLNLAAVDELRKQRDDLVEQLKASVAAGQQFLREANLARRVVPDSGGIVSYPEILGGEPVFAGTRLSVYVVAGRAKAGDDITSILTDYPYLKLTDIALAQEYAERNPRQKK